MNRSSNITSRIIGVFAVIILLFVTEIAEAQYGGARRRTRRRTAIVVSSATHAQDEQQAKEEKEKEDQEAKEAEEEKEEAEAEAKANANKGDLPIGTIVTKLPDNCDSVVVNDVQYYHCKNDYYRVAYQENNLVYVTTEPPSQ